MRDIIQKDIFNIIVNTPKIVLATAYTDGSFSTKNIDIDWINQIALANSNIFVHSFNICKPQSSFERDVLNLGIDYSPLVNYISDCLEIPLIHENWAKVSFFQYKPKILKYLSELYEPSVYIFWVDADAVKYSSYPAFVSYLVSNIESLIQNKHILLFAESVKSNFNIQCDIKRFPKHDLDKLRYYPVYWAGVMVFRNTNFSNEFISRWLKMCLPLKNLIPLILSKDSNPMLRCHAQEQVMLSIVLYNYLIYSPTFNQNKSYDRYSKLFKLVLLPQSRSFPVSFISLKGYISSLVYLLSIKISFRSKIFLIKQLFDSLVLSFL